MCGARLLKGWQEPGTHVYWRSRFFDAFRIDKRSRPGEEIGWEKGYRPL